MPETASTDSRTNAAAPDDGPIHVLLGEDGTIDAHTIDAHLMEPRGQDAVPGRLLTVFENAGLGIGLIDGEGRLFSANPALRRMLAATPPVQLEECLRPDDRATVMRSIRPLLAGECEWVFLEFRLPVDGAAPAWGRLQLSLVRAADGAARFAVAMVEDITARKAVEDQLRLAAKVVEATGDGVFVTDARHRIIHVNPAFTRLTGLTPEDVLGRPPSILSSGRHGKDFYEEMWRAIEDHGHWCGEIWNRKKSGEIYVEWINISAVRDEAGKVTNYVAVFSDITSRKESEEKLQHQASHDALTGLPNRALFNERLERALARAKRNQLVVAVLFLDLDRFKEINDSLGHLAGDSLLLQVARRLSGAVRQADTVARMGGDEFTLILQDINDFRDAATVAKKVLTQFAEPFVLDGHERTVSTSIGISLFPTDGADAAALVRQADEAMYTAKKQGRGSFRFASPDLSEKAFERQSMEAALRRAIDDGGLELHYQPVIDLAANTVVAAEALIRWRHPEIGLMVPGQFLGLAAESRLMPAIGHWVLRNSLSQTAAWRRSGHPDLRLCVNVSGSELQDPRFFELLQRLLAESGLPGSAVDIDVPNSFAMDGGKAGPRAFYRLHKLGCRVTLDDFGGASTDFRALRDIRIDAVKIAPEYIRDVATRGREAELVRAAITVARSLHVQVVAKAVETTDQYEFLKEHGCDGAQGYFFSRPLPPEEFHRLLHAPLVTGE